MKPAHWPDHLNSILAKSADRGGETLAQHTWDVLEKLAALRSLRPTLPELTGMAKLWHILYWTCFLHDFGKAARGFQSMLSGGEHWKQRHEVLSLAFLDWMAVELPKDEQFGILAAIVSHHRDASDIRQKYDDVDPDPVAPLVGELHPDVISGLWHWLEACAIAWRDALGFEADDVRPLVIMPHDEAVRLVVEQGSQRVRHWLRQYDGSLRDLRFVPPGYQVVLPVLLRGLTTTADHMASAHMGQVPSALQEDWKSLAERILTEGQTPFSHQVASAECSGRSALLVAPTGSGKTEAALYWVLGNGTQPVPRLFYALPYQASMNAMYDRLKDSKSGFGKRAVGLQHGRALQALYTRLMDQEARPANAAAVARWEENLNTLHARPVKVFSPYQMLKAAFQLRGFEAMLTDYAQAAFIFDEIHAYEPKRLALMLAMVKYLRQHFGARFFVMSATFPQIIRAKLVDTLELQPKDLVAADKRVFELFQRHRLHLVDGDLLGNGIERIAEDVRAGKSVLVCVNTVRRAQEVRDALLGKRGGLLCEQVLLIHSRYIVKHRTEREGEIMRRHGIRTPHQAGVLVATQVVEVSLNIDLDTIYTDPAPLEALLQRFGRVNRAGSKGICPVHVFRQPDDGQFVYGQDDDPQWRGHIVRVTLAELEGHNGHVIDEAEINTWLDAIYSDPRLKTQWEAAYRSMATQAELILRELRPFDSNPQTEQEFERLFDSIDVLPQRYEQEYLDCLVRDAFIEASQYFVSINTSKYWMLAKRGLVLPAADPSDKADGKRRQWLVRLPYNEDTGLSFDTAGDSPDWD